MTRKKTEKKIIGWFPVTWKDKRGNIYREKISDINNGATFEEMRNRMKEIEDEYGSSFEKFKFESIDQYQYGDSWVEYHVFGWREETDEEFQTRVGEAAAREAERETREKEEYERLKKKFETS